VNTSPASARWMGRAACRGMPARLFYPPPGTPTDTALEVCAGCPVRADCARHAELNGEVFGIWGGRTETERAHDSPHRSDVAVGIVRRRPGPPSAVDDDRLIDLVWSLDPDQPAAAQVVERLQVSVPTAYKYLARAARLGVVERRGRHLYANR
jgi:WhiB family redox-sensing transcriptional regulator